MRIYLQFFGGRGASAGTGGGSGSSNESKPSALEMMKEDSRQYVEALKEAQRQKAAIVEYTGVDGKTHRRYWNGATFVDRSSALYDKERSGTYTATFDKNKLKRK